MTVWFAWQRHPGGIIPVTFTDDPHHSPGRSGVIPSSIVQLPPELEGASLPEIVAALRKPAPFEYPYL